MDVQRASASEWRSGCSTTRGYGQAERGRCSREPPRKRGTDGASSSCGSHMRSSRPANISRHRIHGVQARPSSHLETKVLARGLSKLSRRSGCYTIAALCLFAFIAGCRAFAASSARTGRLNLGGFIGNRWHSVSSAGAATTLTTIFSGRWTGRRGRCTTRVRAAVFELRSGLLARAACISTAAAENLGLLARKSFNGSSGRAASIRTAIFLFGLEALRILSRAAAVSAAVLVTGLVRQNFGRRGCDCNGSTRAAAPSAGRLGLGRGCRRVRRWLVGRTAGTHFCRDCLRWLRKRGVAERK